MQVEKINSDGKTVSNVKEHEIRDATGGTFVSNKTPTFVLFRKDRIMSVTQSTLHINIEKLLFINP